MSGRWTADAIVELSRSYQAACVLAAAAELDVFRVIGHEPQAAETVTARLGADPRAMTTLLDALAALGLLHKEDWRYSAPVEVGQFLTQDGAGSVLAMVRHQANCLRRWAQLGRVVKTGKPAQREPSIRGEAADQATFIEAMDNLCAPIASKIVDEIQPPAFTHLLDVGGASGTWTIAFLQAMPGARATLFDLPHVIRLAAPRIREAGLSDRVELAGGDFLTDALPQGADLAWVSAIVHQNSREQNRRLFAAISKSLADRGRILIRDVLMDASRTSPAAGALFAINMLVGTEGGGTFTLEELRGDLEAAGFFGASVLRRDAGMNSVICACKRQMGPHGCAGGDRGG